MWKKIKLIFILIQLSEMHGAEVLNKYLHHKVKRDQSQDAFEFVAEIYIFQQSK